jgi:phosphatidate cytidylyltransferase
LLRWRLLLGVLLVGGVAALAWLDLHAHLPGMWLFPLAMLVGLGAAHEMATLLAKAGYQPLPGVIYGGSLLVIGSNTIPLFVLPQLDDQPTERLGWPLMAFALVMLWAFVGEMSRYRKPGGVTSNIAVGMLAVAYVGLLLSLVVQLRALGGHVTGMMNLLALIAVVKAADIGAYTVGRLFGRHKMAPVLSPGKTIEGAIGAFVFACLAAYLAFTYLPVWLECNQPKQPLGWLLYGLVVGAAGMLGDLAESLLKRDLGSKDSSTWMPGFGGVLDLIDSIIFAAPVAYLCTLLQST